MSGLLFINVAAALFVLIGFHVAFRHRSAGRRDDRVVARSQEVDGSVADRLPNEPDDMVPVFRMVGVMVMAFSFTIAAFANLIAYYTTTSPN